jgi:phenylalanine ammonia-lyase
LFLGKLAFAQFTELISPHMNRGLPPDLAAFEPSLDFGAKAMDLAMAAYMSGKFILVFPDNHRTLTISFFIFL